MPIPVEGPATANIMIIGDAPSDLDERMGKHFSGNNGALLDQLLREAGITRAEVLLTTISRSKPPGDKLQFFFEDSKCLKPKSYWLQELEVLRDAITSYRPNIIIALGPTALFYLTGNTGIQSFRGYITDCVLVPGIKVLTTHHPKAINMEWKLSFQFVMDIRKAIANSLTPEPVTDHRNLIVASSATEFTDYCDYLLQDHKGPIGLDIETMSPGSHIDIIGLAASENESISFNFMNGRTPKYNVQIETSIWEKIALICKEKELIMQNGGYDSGVLWYNNHILCKHYNRDIMYAAHAAWPECPRSLGYLASICINVPPWKHTAQETPELYNAADAANTVGIWNVLEAEMERQGVRHTHDFEIAQNPVATLLQLQGILIDKDRQSKIVSDTNTRVKELEAELKHAIGKEINFQSPKQLQTLLYIDMGLPPQYKRRTNMSEPQKLTSDAEALTKLSRLTDNPTLKLILEIKKLQKLLTFVDVTLSENNTVHTCYNITGASSAKENNKGNILDDEDSHKSFGRWSSSGSIILPYGSGNLQNIPEAARKMYYAGDGKIFVQADYKQAEAVVVAYLIGDKKLQKLFTDSFGQTPEYCEKHLLDVHKLTAADMFGLALEEVTPAQRKVGKTIRHANNYSAGPGVLAAKLGITMKEAKRLMDIYHMKCPQLRLWQGRIQDELRATRTLTNLLGRKHRFLERWGDELFRSAYSFKPQSTVGDLLNSALVILHEDFGSQIDIALQLHDAIYVRVNEDKEDFAKAALKECMIERVQPLRTGNEEFFIDIDFKSGKYWGDLKD